jgi:hypothetical protein
MVVFFSMNIKCAALLAAILAVPAIASDYQIKTVKVQPIESYSARAAIETVTIAADPYPTDEKSYTAFDVKDLNTRGYFPVHVIIRNSSASFISVKTRDIMLLTGGGQKLYTTPATIVVQDVIKGGLISKLPKMKSHDQSTSTKTGSPLMDFTGKELTNRQIEPGAVSDGFVFFFTDEPKKPLFSGAKILIPQVTEEGTRKIYGPFELSFDAAQGAALK